MYKSKYTKKIRAKLNMQKLLNIYYTIIFATFFCIFDQIVILIKYTKIHAAEYTVAKINEQNIVTQKFLFWHKKLLLQK